jgi:hypothetical protein
VIRSVIRASLLRGPSLVQSSRSSLFSSRYRRPRFAGYRTATVAAISFPDLNWQWLIRRDSAYGRERPATDLSSSLHLGNPWVPYLAMWPVATAFQKTMQFCHDMAELHGSNREGTCDVSILLFERRCHKILFRSGNAKSGGLYSPSTHSRLHRFQCSVRLSGGDSIILMRIHGH